MTSLVDNRVTLVLADIRGDLSADLSLATLALRVNLSQSRLRHLFTAQTGVGLAAFVRGARLDASYRLLQRHETRVSEVAYACGFKNTSHFSKAFRQRFNTTPRAAKKPLRDHSHSGSIGLSPLA